MCLTCAEADLSPQEQELLELKRQESMKLGQGTWDHVHKILAVPDGVSPLFRQILQVRLVSNILGAALDLVGQSGPELAPIILQEANGNSIMRHRLRHEKLPTPKPDEDLAKLLRPHPP